MTDFLETGRRSDANLLRRTVRTNKFREVRFEFVVTLSKLVIVRVRDLWLVILVVEPVVMGYRPCKVLEFGGRIFRR